ncbi:MAG: hypothetical protein HC835_06645 [Oscillatoriales cyanobacterium RM2_1_1]|nr:hypothetical protein [Oscillatoriales cyanobacterium SM2_3_0]NJO45326.1 hypothetical protein [Oscillatoriales cyanobacterium RM2_1_1]
MNYSIPANWHEMLALGNQSVDEEVVARAIAGVISIAKSQHQSLEDLKAEVMADDNLLNPEQRAWLSEIIAEVWHSLP